MVALLASERQRVLVLFDDEKQSRGTKDELIKSRLIRDDNVVFVTAGFPAGSGVTEADTEDLLDPHVFDALVRESYALELKGKTLSLNGSIPRIVKRYESAFEGIGLEFHKTRPARLLLAKMATEPEKIATVTTAARFGALFRAIGRAHLKNVARSAEPFR